VSWPFAWINRSGAAHRQPAQSGCREPDSEVSGTALERDAVRSIRAAGVGDLAGPTLRRADG